MTDILFRTDSHIFSYREYERVSQNVMELQMALDQYNQTVQFEVDL